MKCLLLSQDQLGYILCVSESLWLPVLKCCLHLCSPSHSIEGTNVHTVVQNVNFELRMYS